MAKKLTMNGQFRKSVAEVFDDFVISPRDCHASVRTGSQ